MHQLTRKMLVSVGYTLLLQALLATSQACENYGFQNDSSCACPPGFGGSDCSQPACGGTIFQGAQRSLTPVSGSFANVTAAGCTCETDWTGMGCNVCKTASACQTGYTASGHSASTSSLGTETGQNNTLVCNTSPQVWASSQMSCNVIVRLSFYLGILSPC